MEVGALEVSGLLWERRTELFRSCGAPQLQHHLVRQGLHAFVAEARSNQQISARRTHKEIVA
eukprot:3538859-Amphidinium_carterae.1